MPSEESPEARFDRLKRQLQDSILRDYPNPERTGCPGDAVLRRLAETPLRARDLAARVSPLRQTERHAARKTIDDFRADPRYGGDNTRIGLAFAIYALSHGAAAGEVAAAIRSRDLSHKGNEKRQAQYVERTLAKASGRITGRAP